MSTDSRARELFQSTEKDATSNATRRISTSSTGVDSKLTNLQSDLEEEKESDDYPPSTSTSAQETNADVLQQAAPGPLDLDLKSLVKKRNSGWKDPLKDVPINKTRNGTWSVSSSNPDGSFPNFARVNKETKTHSKRGSAKASETNKATLSKELTVGMDDLRTLMKNKSTSTNQLRTTAKKGVLKKVSSYGCREEIGESIPICTKKSNYKSLPVPNLDRKAARMKRANTTPVLQLATVTETKQPQDKASSMMKRNVSFSKVMVRDYDITAGDAACMVGPPIALDWQYDEWDPIDLSDYECNRPMRRSQEEMHVKCWQRANILKYRAGLSDEEVLAAAKAAEKAFRQRSWTNSQPKPLMKLEGIMESASRKARRLARSRGMKSKKNISTGHVRSLKS